MKHTTPKFAVYWTRHDKQGDMLMGEGDTPELAMANAKDWMVLDGIDAWKDGELDAQAQAHKG